MDNETALALLRMATDLTVASTAKNGFVIKDRAVFAASGENMLAEWLDLLMDKHRWLTSAN